MRILITGANGFIGYYLTELLLKKGIGVIATGKGESRLPFDGQQNFHYACMDFTDPFAVHDVFARYKPGAVIHAGGMTRADACELNQWDAYITNVEATVTLLLNSEEHKCFFVFLSTDFVFDGLHGMYSEKDQTGPVNFYGKTKVEAEDAVKEYEYGWAIIRTVLVYGRPMTGGNNILTIIKDKLEKKERVHLVNDQFRTPTYVEDLVEGIFSIIQVQANGIFHLAGKDILTPYEMGQLLADLLVLDRSLIMEANESSFKEAAKRPAHTGFNIDKAREVLGFEPMSFEEGLRRSFA